MIIILAVDPGKASGIAVLSWAPESNIDPKVLHSSEEQPEDFGAKIEELLEYKSQTDDFVVSCESFIINAQTVRNSQAPWSLENIGVLKHLCRKSGYDVSKIVFQSPANAKSMFPNPSLKKLGTWHKGGEGHANDAIRHGLLTMVKVGWKPTSLLQ